jgi:hypothetical protein
MDRHVTTAVRTVSNVGAWKQSGRLFFWRFTENVRDYPGWNYMLDPAGAKSVAALLHVMSKSETGCSRVVQVSQPTTEVLRIPNNRGAGCVTPTKLRIELDIADPDAWSLDDDGVALHWRLGSRTAQIAEDAFANPGKYFDSTIGARPALWSWGLLKSASPSKSPGRKRDR